MLKLSQTKCESSTEIDIHLQMDKLYTNKVARILFPGENLELPNEKSVFAIRLNTADLN